MVRILGYLVSKPLGWRGCLCLLVAAVALILGPMSLASSPSGNATSEAGRDSNGWGRFISEWNLDLVVGRVVAVSDAGATNGHPPLVTLEVERVLRGNVRSGMLDVLWGTVPLSTSMQCGNMTAAERAAEDRYYAERVNGPHVGTRWLLAGRRPGSDSLWHSLPEVRFGDDANLWRTITMQTRRADERHGFELAQDRLQRRTQAGADDRARRAANLDALVRASTDIVVARIGSREHDLQILERLYEAPHDSLANRINASMLTDAIYRTLGPRLSLEGSLDAVARLVAAGDSIVEQQSDTTYIPGTYLCFLRRRAILPYDGGFIPMAMTDPTTGVMPVDSTMVRSIRRIVARESRLGPWKPSSPAECGASWDRFAALRDTAWNAIRVRVMYVRPGGYSARRQSFEFGFGLADRDRGYFPLCDACGELAWSDQISPRYTVPLQRDAMAGWIRSLARQAGAATNVPSDSVVAIVTVRGLINGRMLSAERRLSELGLARAAQALTRLVEPDSSAAWRVNYWKHAFGPPLVPEDGWHLAGR